MKGMQQFGDGREGNLVEGQGKIHIHSQFEGMYVTLYRLITSNEVLSHTGRSNETLLLIGSTSDMVNSGDTSACVSTTIVDAAALQPNSEVRTSTSEHSATTVFNCKQLPVAVAVDALAVVAIIMMVMVMGRQQSAAAGVP